VDPRTGELLTATGAGQHRSRDRHRRARHGRPDQRDPAGG
jgi:hypothetical protein